MARSTRIEWTDRTWNPVTGCTKLSQGCKNCYAERFALQLQAQGVPRYARGFRLTLHPDLLDRPLQWRTPSRIFVNSMSDLFHEEVPVQFIGRVFDVMQRCPHHQFQVLTKRSRRLRDLAPFLPWPPNVWMGVSIENEQVLGRIDDLVHVPAAIRFLSCEPLLGPLPHLPLDGIHWVIVGGESGPNARPMQAEWAIQILRQCQSKNIPFFFKQWGGEHRTAKPPRLLGQIYHQYPIGGSHEKTVQTQQRSLLEPTDLLPENRHRGPGSQAKMARFDD